MESFPEKLNHIASGIHCLLPELVIVAGILGIIILELLFNKRKYVPAAFGLLVVIATFYFSFLQLSNVGAEVFGMLIVNEGAAYWKLLLDFAAFGSILLTVSGSLLRFKAESIAITLGILLGAHLLVMSTNLLSVYLSVELMSISAYILTNYNFTGTAHEAGFKYLLFGAVSSAILLYGISILYFITGTLDYATPGFADRLMEADVFSLAITGIFILGGILFKISAFPFHVWSPDVYEAAPTSLVVLFSTVPKLAGITLLIKWLLVFNLFGQSPVNWIQVLAVITMITLLVGNFAALWQQKVKRMLAYSSIAHSGFLMIAVVAFSDFSMQSLYFYACTYVLTSVAVFSLLQKFEKLGDDLYFSQFRGSFKYFPFTGVLLVVIMISFTGLPPTAGFSAKLLVFSGLWESYKVTGSDTLAVLLVFGLLNAVVSLFYYLKIPYLMIFKEENSHIKSTGPKFSTENFLALIMVTGLLLLFFRPDWLMNYLNNVNFAF